MKENPNGHRLRARLAGMLGAILCNVEPFQAAAARCLEGYHSAKIFGDVDSEMYCGLCYGFSSLFCCSDLVDLRKTFGFFIQQMVGILVLCIISGLVDNFSLITAGMIFSWRYSYSSTRLSASGSAFYTVPCKSVPPLHQFISHLYYISQDFPALVPGRALMGTMR